MKKNIVFWIEEYFYHPTFIQKLLSFLLLPLSFLYCFIMYVRFKMTKVEDFGVKIISVGNLSVGGSGKTPLVTALASKYQDVAIILRGYGRASKGLVVVKDKEKILCDVATSGDEAMIYALKLPQSVVIVSEDRKKAIQKAKEMGVKVIFLDDGYSKHFIKKLDILIDVMTPNRYCFPSGPFRERLYKEKKALVVQEEKDFTRVVNVKDKYDKMSLVTAIARPNRLDKYLPKVVSKNYFEDHHTFTKDELEAILQKDNADALLVTFKDYVKIKSFDLPLALLDLDIEVDEKILQQIGNYIAKED
ncbi:Tetraacyldisaccharide 4'-kinase [hydrothermal vent metagenome]|uniref:tetraacyldisaccharide 4'-kinase n=1 Tax=hydrothermal vent metagenome TaxID=652676 RepID=A0A1W1D349_9ZZZZ